MLIQVTTPRPIFDASKYPQYIHIHTLQKAGVSTGDVYFVATVDPEHGTKQGRALEPVNEYPIERHDGLVALEYVLPFWELFKKTAAMSNAQYNGRSAAEQGIVVADVHMARYCANGFQVTAKSAFRADSRTYEGHTVAFTIMTAVTGGGILRLADCPFDLSNSTFDPWAPGPTVQKDLALQESYNRTHRALPAGADAKRAARIAEAEADARRNAERKVEVIDESKKPKGLLEQAKKLLGGG